MYNSTYKPCIDNVCITENPNLNVGFIPFGFANDKRMLYTVITISAIFMLLWLWFTFQK